MKSSKYFMLYRPATLAPKFRTVYASEHGAFWPITSHLFIFAPSFDQGEGLTIEDVPGQAAWRVLG